VASLIVTAGEVREEGTGVLNGHLALRTPSIRDERCDRSAQSIQLVAELEGAAGQVVVVH
jgi:hypothetical protein